VVALQKLSVLLGCPFSFGGVLLLLFVPIGVSALSISLAPSLPYLKQK
jgi:hypothetical protein